MITRRRPGQVASLQRAYMMTNRQPRLGLGLALLLLAAASCLLVACGTTYGPGSGTLIGVVRPCTAGDAAPDFARVVTVYAQNQGGQTVVKQRLPRRVTGTRYRMRLPAGPYTINASAGGNSAGLVVTVTARETATVNFTGGGGCV